MGDGGDLPGALRRSAALGALVACAGVAGCIDFVEPDLPDLGAPAVIEATIRLTDRGTVDVDARLVPGLGADGFRRELSGNALEVLGRALEPDSVQSNGTRRYLASWSTDPGVVGQTVSLRAPAVKAVTAPPPAMDWVAVERAGPDSLGLEAGQDLSLRVRVGSSPLQPKPAIRQWFLRLGGKDGAFNISADGPPPDTIFVPARWIPAGDSIEARLIFSQSVNLQDPPGDYLGLITLDTRLFWTVRVRASGPQEKP